LQRYLVVLMKCIGMFQTFMLTIAILSCIIFFFVSPPCSTVFQQLQHARHATAAAVEKSALAEKSAAALQQRLRAAKLEAAQQRAASDAAAKEARKNLAEARARIAELCVGFSGFFLCIEFHQLIL
jgi:hypothetical protein